MPKFVDEAKLHFHAFGIGDLLLDQKIAHVGITAATTEEYKEYLNYYRELAAHVSDIEHEGQQISYMTLKAPLLYSSQSVDTLEITHPKQNDIITTAGMIDHITFFVSDMKIVMDGLQKAGIKPMKRTYPDGVTVGVEFNEFLQEVRFSSFTNLSSQG